MRNALCQDASWGSRGGVGVDERERERGSHGRRLGRCSKVGQRDVRGPDTGDTQAGNPKSRVTELADFVDTLERIAKGASVIDARGV